VAREARRVEVSQRLIDKCQHTLQLRLGMTQHEFAKALRIPLSTLRNWEQGRVLPDPAARSLLTIVANNPKAAFKALAA
jgi:putative transcriptional regulator